MPAGYSLIDSFNFPYNYNGTKDGSFFGFVTSNVYVKADVTSGHLAFSYVFNNLSPFPGAPLTDIVRATINDRVIHGYRLTFSSQHRLYFERRSWMFGATRCGVPMTAQERVRREPPESAPG